MGSATTRTIIIASLTMVAFAFNSVFARAALGENLIDPASYTSIRLIAGAFVLFVLITLRKKKSPIPASGSWLSAFWLFIYAVFLSFAYISLDTGIGALILFACVQATMIGFGIYQGERPGLLTWVGNLVAIAGFIYLVSPGISSPDPFGAVLMAISGIAWGIYSARGKGAGDPLGTTAQNFFLSVPMTIGVSLLFIGQFDLNAEGVLYAVLSGGVTSALGYALWYTALKGFDGDQSSHFTTHRPAHCISGRRHSSIRTSHSALMAFCRPDYWRCRNGCSGEIKE